MVHLDTRMEIEKELLFLLREYRSARQNRIKNGTKTAILKIRTSDWYGISLVLIHAVLRAFRRCHLVAESSRFIGHARAKMVVEVAASASRVINILWSSEIDNISVELSQDGA